MENIKSFIYLDNEKMYSLSSQLFEGLVERFIESELTEKSEEEKQKGPIGSGNYLADMLKLQKERKEDKFLHDYLYTKFEKELFEKEKIIDVNLDCPENLSPFKIIKVKGRMIFNDANEIIKTIREFNNLGETISYMHLFSEKQQLEQQVKEEVNQIKDRNQKVKTMQKKSSAIKNQIKQYAKENGLNLDAEFLKKLEYALKFGLDDMLEIQLQFADITFSSVLNRNFLKEPEKLLVYKLSRYTEREVTLIGIVTQGNDYELKSKDEDEEVDSGEPSFKQAFRNMVDKLIDVENVFIGKSIGEVIVDPIAVYLEL